MYISAILISPSGPQWQEKSHDVLDMTTSNPVNQVFYSFIFILAFSTIIPHYKKFLKWLNNEKFVVFFLVWCGFTIVFAIDSFTAFKRYFQYITTSLVFISFYLNFSDSSNLLKILRVSFVIYLFLTLVVCLIIPDATDPSFNTWRGFHATKNNLGQYAAINFLFFSYNYSLAENIRARFFFFGFVLLSLLVLFGAFSMTNIVLVSLFSFTFLILNFRKFFDRLGISLKFSVLIIAVLSLLILCFILIYPEVYLLIFQLIDKDPTLTGRTEIWTLVLAQSINDLITGVGFQSFWIPEKLSRIILFQYWMPTQSHNGYVDMMLEIGIIGLFLFILFCYSIFKASIFKKDMLWVIIIIYVLALNFSESTLIRPHHFSNVMFYCSFWSISFRKNFNNIFSD